MAELEPLSFFLGNANAPVSQESGAPKPPELDFFSFFLNFCARLWLIM
jgi:hypothetical protein